MPQKADSTPQNPRGKSRDPFEDFERVGGKDNRPRIPPPGKSGRDALSPKIKVDAYSRASSIGETLESQVGLGEWRLRQVVFGIGRRKDLYIAASSVRGNDGPNKAILASIADKALDAAESSAGATIGTAIHALREQHDEGRNLDHVSGEVREALDKWVELTAGFEVLASEAKTVCDRHRVAGTFDVLLRLLGPMTMPDGTVLPAGTVTIGDLKGLALDTPIPTPDGWTAMGEVQVGDRVFGSDGRPCTVTAKSEVKHLPTYVVEFDGGERIVCDHEHLWWVKTGLSHRRGMFEQVVDVETLAGSTHDQNGKALHRVPVAGALDLPDADLPIDPYLLGCWIGDGTRSSGKITGESELFEILQADGHAFGSVGRTASEYVSVRTVLGLAGALREAGYLGRKRIPEAYLRGSVEQRIVLLRGLMDTDGTWKAVEQRAAFCTVDKDLAGEFRELCVSLGLKARTHEESARGFGIATTAYVTLFSPVGFNPFRLPRKVARAAERTRSLSRSLHRTIRSVEPGPDVATQCIAVDSPNRTYLCGHDMIPTHNTSSTADYFGVKFAVQLAEYTHGVPFDVDSYGRITWEDLGGRPHPKWAIIIHIPTGAPKAGELHAVDVESGDELTDLAFTVRAQRKRKDLVVAVKPPLLPAAMDAAGLLAAIMGVHGTADEAKVAFNGLWREHRLIWSATHKRAADARLDQIAQLASVGG